MSYIIRRSEALRRNEVTENEIRFWYQNLFPDVYMPKVTEPTLYDYTVGAYLWSGGGGVVTGRAAAAMHGALWVDVKTPIELLYTNHHPPERIITRDEHFIVEDVVEFYGIAVATPARAAYDMGRHLPRGTAVAHLDSLSRATGLTKDDVAPLIARYKGARNIRRLRTAVDLMDGGAQSPKESWLRLLLIDAGYPRPTTQIPVHDEWGYPFAYLDMGWEDVKIAVEYDGEHHGTDVEQWKWDVRRLRKVRDRAWLHVKVVGGDRPADIIERVERAWSQRRTGTHGREAVG
jgi:hypothetical protein